MTAAILPVRVLVTGIWNDSNVVEAVLDGMLLAMTPGALTVIHSGSPHGVDPITDDWCRRRGVAVQRFPANRQHHGAADFGQAMRAFGVNRCLAFIADGSAAASDRAASLEAAGITTLRYTWPGR